VVPIGRGIIVHACRCRRVWILDLDPIGTPAGPVGPITALGDNALQPHGTYGPENFPLSLLGRADRVIE
jgi:hypothetical protein